ncbi:unnamed protein product [Caenorhabditis brenneri]
MTFPLLRLPFLTLQEVIKSMNVRNIVMFPSLSRKCHKVVKVSISTKSSLEIAFTSVGDGIVVKISPKSGFRFNWINEEHGFPLRIGDDFLVTAYFSTCGNWAKFNLTRSGQEAQDEELIKTVLKYFDDTIKPSVKFDFNFEMRQKFAMKLIRYCRLNHIRLSFNAFECGDSESPEEIREILEDCVEENGNLCIDSSLPEGFEYTPPPGGFKLHLISVTKAHWINLNDFLQCEHIRLYDSLHHMTPEYLNNVFKTIVNTECRIKFLQLISEEFFSYSFPEVIRGLTDRPISRSGSSLSVKFEGNDGRTTTILHHHGAIVLKRK